MPPAPINIPPDTDLPSLPQIALRALEACHSDASFRDIARIIDTDTALCGRMLALANSALYRQANPVKTIEQAMLRLGIRQIESLIITASLRQLLVRLEPEHWQQLRDFWRHSLTTALIARALARLTRYPSTEEAYMVGLLHNAGELVLMSSPADHPVAEYPASELGAALCHHWGFDRHVEDAVRYQQESPDSIRDAGHLVKLVHLSTRLALADSGGLDAAHLLFGLTSALTREICTGIEQDVQSLADSLNIDLSGSGDDRPARDRLFREVVSTAMIERVMQDMPNDLPFDDVMLDGLRHLTMLTGRPASLLTIADRELTLREATVGGAPAMTIPLDAPQSLVTRAVETGDMLVGDADSDKATVLDRQLMSLLGTPTLMTRPVVTAEGTGGVYVIGLQARASAERYRELLTLFGRHVHRRLTEPAPAPDSQHLLDQASRQLAVRRQVHEISNPLTIVRQYVSQLQRRLANPDSDTETMDNDLTIVREELDRAAHLLEQLREVEITSLDETPGDDPITDLNDELETMEALFRESLFRSADIESAMERTSASGLVRARRGALRQVVTNLVRNAVEAMPEGGRITLQTDAPVWQGTKQWVELTISDSGRGLPDSIRQTLFQPVASTKGAGHSGLGLSIVKQIVDDMEGIISCKTGAGGTSFRILLPAAGKDQ
ncbi:histidine kinase/DNA gyrase B/HSP90-like ATPase [Tamilnaduibacter salinus]|uniref:histidine kinase n=1 Tax=Tamilnaduibacter salinus TaxID=1484056 RepID=A0A2U1D0U2_9GAMM|nr:HDOD domain-containing protein [Tamilnaduibacter salinus]PVY79006.1 histidine kinase/DNA gyrase B/HSP90-like ATPase [Tamilnaduibacter salinus]